MNTEQNNNNNTINNNNLKNNKMRKTTYFKTMLLTIVLVIGSMGVSAQESVIYSTGFESAQGFTATTAYNNTTILNSGVAGQQWSTFYGTPSTTSPLVGLQTLQMRWYTSTAANLGYTFTNFDMPNVTKVTFKAANTTGINLIASYSTDGGTTYTGNQTFTLTSTSTQYTLNVSATGEFANVRIKFAVSLANPAPTGTSRLYIDDVNVYGMAGIPVTAASIPTFSTGTGNYFTPQSIVISSATAGASIYYTTDGTSPDNTKTLYTVPVSVNATSTIKAIAYATGLDASAVTEVTYTYPVEVVNIAALRAFASSSVLYKLTGQAMLTYQTADYGKSKYIQDATGAILIYDGSSKITTPYSLNDGITGIIGSLSLYNGMLEFIPATDPGVASSSNNTIIPVQVTLDNLSNYEGQLVKVNNISIAAGTFAASTNSAITNSSLSGFLRPAYTDLDYIGAAIPTANQDITGVVLNISTTQTVLVPRSLADFTPSVTTGITNPGIASIISASKGLISLSALAGERVELYNVTGQKLLSQLTVEGLNTIPVAARGVVIVKVGNRISKVIL